MKDTNRFNVGDLVVHARGTMYPYQKLRGVVVKNDIFENPSGGNVYRVFWYTTGHYQNLSESYLTLLEKE